MKSMVDHITMRKIGGGNKSKNSKQQKDHRDDQVCKTPFRPAPPLPSPGIPNSATKNDPSASPANTSDLPFYEDVRLAVGSLLYISSSSESCASNSSEESVETLVGDNVVRYAKMDDSGVAVTDELDSGDHETRERGEEEMVIMRELVGEDFGHALDGSRGSRGESFEGSSRDGGEEDHDEEDGNVKGKTENLERKTENMYSGDDDSDKEKDKEDESDESDEESDKEGDEDHENEDDKKEQEVARRTEVLLSRITETLNQPKKSWKNTLRTKSIDLLSIGKLLIEQHEGQILYHRQQESLLMDCKSALNQQRKAIRTAGKLASELWTKISQQEGELERAAEYIMDSKSGNLDLSARYDKTIERVNDYNTTLKRENEELHLKLAATIRVKKKIQTAKYSKPRTSMVVPANKIAFATDTVSEKIQGKSTFAAGEMPTSLVKSPISSASDNRKESRVSLRWVKIIATPPSSSNSVHVGDAKKKHHGKSDSVDIKNATTITTSSKSNKGSCGEVSGVCSGGGPVGSIEIHSEVSDGEVDSLLCVTTGMHPNSEPSPSPTATLSTVRDSGEVDKGIVEQVGLGDECGEETKVGYSYTKLPAPAPAAGSKLGSLRGRSTSGGVGNNQAGRCGTGASGVTSGPKADVGCGRTILPALAPGVGSKRGSLRGKSMSTKRHNDQAGAGGVSASGVTLGEGENIDCDRMTTQPRAPAEVSRLGFRRDRSKSDKEGNDMTGAGGTSACRRAVSGSTVQGARINSSPAAKTARLTTRRKPPSNSTPQKKMNNRWRH